jgi:hypothetical protein
MTKPRRTALDEAIENAAASAKNNPQDGRWAELLRVLRAARRDKERLDLLQTATICLRSVQRCFSVSPHSQTHTTVRAAIDAAIKAGRRGGK